MDSRFVHFPRTHMCMSTPVQPIRCVPVTPAAIQTAFRLHNEGKSSLHHELKLKRRVQREHGQRERRRSSHGSSSSQPDESNVPEAEKTEKNKDRQDMEIESIIQARDVP